MKMLLLTTSLLSLSFSAAAQETRQLDAHEHGVGKLDIAIDDAQLSMAFMAPGADIVGFEYQPSTHADRALIDAALAQLNVPTQLFVLDDAAGCQLISASAELESEEEHDDHHDDHEDDDHHEEEEHEDDHDDHEDETAKAAHTEFHGEYLYNCTDPAALNQIDFAYFATFPNALEVEVRLVAGGGASLFEVERDQPLLRMGRN